MKNIVLARIDDRLIHGQVVTGWVKETNCNKIFIIDDELSKNILMQRILKGAAPPGIKVEVITVADSIIELKKDPLKDEKIMILVKTPQVLENLIVSEVKLEKIVLGGIGRAPGRQKFIKNVSASGEEVECMKRIVGKGVRMNYQLVPGERAVDLKNIF